MKFDARTRHAIVAIAGYSLVLQGPLTLAARQSQPAAKPAAVFSSPDWDVIRTIGTSRSTGSS